MSGLDYRTAGESHGPALIALVEGLPAGLDISIERMNRELARRQGGYGRGGRQRIERDEATIFSGVRRGRTIGSPVALHIANRDSRIDDAPPLHRPRPGHADLAGSLKYLTADCRETLERASARETAARVAAGALARCLLDAFGIEVVAWVRSVGEVDSVVDLHCAASTLRQARDANDAYCPDGSAAARMIEVVRQAAGARDTVGGVIEARVTGHPPGLGSCMRWQDKLDGRLMHAVGSIQAIKGVEFGLGFSSTRLPGSAVHDEIAFDEGARQTPALGFVRPTNNAGGLEGGMANGAPILLRAAMKPISTLLRGMNSVNLLTLNPERSDYERSDVAAVAAASVVVENVVAFEIARAFLEKFGGDTMVEVRGAYERFLDWSRASSNRGIAESGSG